MKSRFVTPRASRTALIVASVPLETNRIFSMKGIDRVISVASSSSSSVVTPKLVPRRAWSAIASLMAGFACPTIIAPQEHTKSSSSFAAALDDQRLSTDGPESPDGAVHAANQHLLGALENLARTFALALHSGLRCTHVFSIKLARLQPACDILGMVGKNNFSSGALDAREDFQDNSLFIQPTLLRRRFDHGVLSADVVSADRNIKGIAHPPDNIQVRQRGLNHDHVRAFFEIKLHFFQRFPHIGRIHLITAPVAKLGSRLSRFPERPVEARAIFRGIRKNGNVLEPVFIQRFTNGPHTPVHHV